MGRPRARSAAPRTGGLRAAGRLLSMRIKRAEKYGFCAGVRIADLKVKKFARGGSRGAILGQVVHNERVVRRDGGARRAHRRGPRRGDRGRSSSRPTACRRRSTTRARRRGLQDPRHHLPVRLRHPRRGAARRSPRAPHLVFIGDPGHREVIGYTHDLDPRAPTTWCRARGGAGDRLGGATQASRSSTRRPSTPTTTRRWRALHRGRRHGTSRAPTPSATPPRRTRRRRALGAGPRGRG